MNLTLETKTKETLVVPDNAVVVGGSPGVDVWETWQRVNSQVLVEKETDLLAEGYRELAQDDYALAEADMAAGWDTLPDA